MLQESGKAGRPTALAGYKSKSRDGSLDLRASLKPTELIRTAKTTRISADGLPPRYSDNARPSSILETSQECAVSPPAEKKRIKIRRKANAKNATTTESRAILSLQQKLKGLGLNTKDVARSRQKVQSSAPKTDRSRQGGA